MFSEPKNGWVDINIGEWSNYASYLTNPHYDFFDAFENILGNRRQSCVYMDAEGHEFIVVLDYNCVYIIMIEETESLKVIQKDIVELAEEFYNDVKRDIEAWIHWFVWTELYEEDDLRGKKAQQAERRKLNRKLQKLRKVIDEYKNR